MAKRAFIIHGWGGFPEEGWFPWLKQELEQKGFIVHVPAMPDASHPTINTWMPMLTASIGNADEDTYLIGHSLGCRAIMIYLQSLGPDLRIGGAVFVAPVVTEQNMTDRLNEAPGARDVLGPWITTPIQWDAIRSHSRFFYGVFSDNDRWIRPETAAILEKQLHAKTIVLHHKSHFSGDDNITELPEVLDAIMNMIER